MKWISWLRTYRKVLMDTPEYQRLGSAYDEVRRYS